jgi:cell wall-associated NlpC family hydrolase
MIIKKLSYLIVLFLLSYFLTDCKSKKKLKSDFETNKEEFTESQKIVAEKMNMSIHQVKAHSLYKFISEWYGTPYSYSSCNKSGVDCSCFTNLLYQNVFKMNLPRSSKEMFDKCNKINKNNLQEGDLVFFNTNGKGTSHVGVYLKDGKFVHASTKKGVMISHMDEEYFKKTFCGACSKK